MPFIVALNQTTLFACFLISESKKDALKGILFDVNGLNILTDHDQYILKIT